MGAPVLSLIAVAFLGVAQAAKPEIAPLQATYRTTVFYQAQSHDAGSRTVTVIAVEMKEVGAWRVVSELRFKELVTADTVEFRRADLHPLGRRAKLGDLQIELTVDGDVVRGLLVASRQLVPLNLALSKASFLNYYALRTAIAGWPIERSWHTEASILELNGEPQFMPIRLAVVGEERISVPAGTYDCWVVTVEGAAGGFEVNEHYWVTKQDQIVVRTREPFGDEGALLRLELSQLSRP